MGHLVGIGELNFKNLFLKLKGRISRQTFWISIIILIVAQILITIILQLMGLSRINEDGTQNIYFWVSLLGVFLLFLWPLICVSTKRYHDRGKSGWWQLVLLIPIGGLVVFIVDAGLLRGVQGRNRYGADPFRKASPFNKY